MSAAFAITGISESLPITIPTCAIVFILLLMLKIYRLRLRIQFIERLIELLGSRYNEASVYNNIFRGTILADDCDSSQFIIRNRNIRMTVKVCLRDVLGTKRRNLIIAGNDRFAVRIVCDVILIIRVAGITHCKMRAGLLRDQAKTCMT